METTKTKTREEYEQILTRIVKSLPLKRVTQVIDFARFIETQVDEEFDLETPEEIAASEAKWDELFAHPNSGRVLRELAAQARADRAAGLNTEMEFDDKDNLIEPK